MRKYFTKIKDAIPLPEDLIQIQKDSFDWFLEEGLKELFDEFFPVKDPSGEIVVEFVDYYLGESKYDEAKSKAKNTSYEAPLRATLRLINKRTKDVKEQEVYLGDMPLITERGTFIINGVERVVVSQIMRSPGVLFTCNEAKGERLFGAKIIPDRGAWLELETESDGEIIVRIYRKRKVSITALLRAFGYGTDKEILDLFKDVDTNPDKKYIQSTILKDSAKNQAQGYEEVYRRIRPGDLATVDNAKQMIESMFFNFERYDLGRAGRYKMNRRFGVEYPFTSDYRILRPEDLILVIKEIIKLNNTSGAQPDDIDHLSNRRVRALGELVQIKFRLGLSRLIRNMEDRLSTMDLTLATPLNIINPRTIAGVIKEFFSSSQLSQFMEQHNPLSELEHKRLLNAMGQGGLSRERAGFEVRDVHPSHYGRICPIETPEGPNIGLVGHLTCYAKINKFGFLETPYRKVIRQVKNSPSETEGKILAENMEKDGKILFEKGEAITKEIAEKIKGLGSAMVKICPIVTSEIEYLDAYEEDKYIIAHAGIELSGEGYFQKDEIEARIFGQSGIANVSSIDYMDVSPKQSISIATALIPFVEHDDGKRALMGSNMQRQAVACVNPQSPVVGTGIEEKAARDSGQVLISKTDGEVCEVDADHIVVKDKTGKKTVCNLLSFVRSNMETSVNQQPRVNKGDKVKKGDLLADGSATDKGELALGQNLLVAFMSWGGSNYEDAIIISEKLVRDDRFSSIHIEDFTVDVRDTKLGPEIITRDIPNVGEEKLKDLDEDGIIRIGAKVNPLDILVGKITPKGEGDLTAEERLLRALFGEKARDVKDTSLRLQHGDHGTVVGIKIFSRDQGDKLQSGVIKSIQVSVAQLRKVAVGDKLAGRHGNKGVIAKVLKEEDMPFSQDGTPVDIILNPLGVMSRMNIGQILETHLGWAANVLGYKVASPALSGISIETIKEQLRQAGLPEDGQVHLYDGRTGQKFNYKSTVGIIYMMKLGHLVEDKIHMRSIGPYSLITQQPLGGKAQFGGQRFGEMEVWALEGYGAAHTLQEILTIKSDDVAGRSKAYTSIIEGESIKSPHIPEAFNVLVSEMKSLGLDVELVKDENKVDENNLTI
ncbi:MAG: DNA-directed RNA polymerase subunit beta [bacterium]